MEITKVVSDYIQRAFSTDVSYIEFFSRIKEFKEWYEGETKWHKYTIWTGKKRKSQKYLSLGMAKTCCEDMASLLMTEKVEIKCANASADALLKKVLKNNNFAVESNQLTELALALGTGAFVVSIKPNADMNNITVDDLVLSYIHGDFIFPIKWDNGKITDCAFVTIGNENGNVTYKVMSFVYDEQQKEFLEYVTEINGEGGTVKGSDVVEGIDNVENKGLQYSTKLKRSSPFQIIKPNIVNNIDKTNPMGISIFGNAISVLKSIDETYSSYKNEFRLGRKRIFVKAGLQAIRYDKTSDNWIDYIDENEVVYQQLGDEWENNKPPIYESNMTLRVDEHDKAMQTHLNLLSRKVGLGENFYTFSNGVISTATQIISSNSSLFRNIRKHELVLKDALIGLAEAICEYLKVDPGEISVNFDDSIIIDTESEKQQAMTEFEKGLIDKVEYFVITRKMTRKQALDFVNEMQATGTMQDAEELLAQKYSNEMGGNDE